LECSPPVLSKPHRRGRSRAFCKIANPAMPNVLQKISWFHHGLLGDWVDFVFVPTPEVVAIYADHDEYTTFYTRDNTTLKNLASGLEKSGFEAVRDYTRRSSGDKCR
jgi:hypothetical protein